MFILFRINFLRHVRDFFGTMFKMEISSSETDEEELRLGRWEDYDDLCRCGLLKLEQNNDLIGFLIMNTLLFLLSNFYSFRNFVCFTHYLYRPFPLIWSRFGFKRFPWFPHLHFPWQQQFIFSLNNEFFHLSTVDALFKLLNICLLDIGRSCSKSTL